MGGAPFLLFVLIFYQIVREWVQQSGTPTTMCEPVCSSHRFSPVGEISRCENRLGDRKKLHPHQLLARHLNGQFFNGQKITLWEFPFGYFLTCLCEKNWWGLTSHRFSPIFSPKFSPWDKWYQVCHVWRMWHHFPHHFFSHHRFSRFNQSKWLMCLPEMWIGFSKKVSFPPFFAFSC